MDALTAGANIATIATGLSAVTAAYVWIMGRVRDRQQQKAAIAERNWHGYVMPEGISDWYVRLAGDPKEVTATVVLNVVDCDGEPDASRAHDLRQTIIGDGMLARVPTPEEYDFLRAQRKERGYGKGFTVR